MMFDIAIEYQINYLYQIYIVYYEILNKIQSSELKINPPSKKKKFDGVNILLCNTRHVRTSYVIEFIKLLILANEFIWNFDLPIDNIVSQTQHKQFLYGLSSGQN